MSEEIKEFFKTYTEKVWGVDATTIGADWASQRIKTPRLLTAALGLGSETGEFVEIVKKMFLQGKPPSEDNIFHMKRELGDIMWYWVTACASLGLDPYEVISENQEKLAARYGEKFEVERSEVRKKGDL